MSFATGSSAIARLADHKMTNVLDIRNTSDIIDNALISAIHTPDAADSADMDTTLKTIFGMIIISALTGNTILPAFCAVLLIIAHRITIPEDTTVTDVDSPTLLENAAPSNPIQDAHIDNEPSEVIPLTEEEAHVYRHARPTFDIIEVLTPAPVSEINTITTFNDNDCFGTLASDVFNPRAFEKYLQDDKMYLVHTAIANPAITSASKTTNTTKKTKKIAKAARPAPKICKSRPNPNLTTEQ